MKQPVTLQPADKAHEGINSYGAAWMFLSDEGLEPAELRCFARDTVRAVASGCDAAGAKDVSHVKLFLEHTSGFLHANAVSGNQEITVGGRDGSTAKRFRLVLNAVIFGLSAQAIQAVAEQAVDVVQVQYGLTAAKESGKE